MNNDTPPNRIMLSILALSSVILAVLWLQFSIHTATSWLEFPRFLATFVFLFLLPGIMVTRWLGLRMPPIEHLNLSLVLGLITTSALYVVLAWTQLPFLLWLWCIAGLVNIFMHRLTLENILGCMMASRLHHLFLLLALVGGWLPLYFLSFYYGNLSWVGDGGLTYDGVEDILLHATIAAELTHTFPPQVPFIAGEQLNYHIGMDVVTAILNRYGGVSIADMIVRFCPTLFITSIMLSAYCLTRRIIGSGGAGVAAALLITLGEDMSFIPGLLQQSEEIWSAYFFQAPTMYSLYYFNSMVVGLSLLLTSFLCLYYSVEEKGWGWSIASSICVAALIQTKIFIFVHFVAALGITMGVGLLVFRRLLFLRQATMVLLISLPLVLYTLTMNSSKGLILWTWSSGIDNFVIPAFNAAQWPLLAGFPILGLIAYLTLTYGFRLLGLGELIKSLRPSPDRPIHLFLAIFVVIGPLISLTSKITPHDYPDSYNNAIWFMVTSKYVAVLFSVAALLKLWSWVAPVWRPALIVFVAAGSLPSTIQYVVMAPAVELGKLERSEMETIAFLNHEAKAGDIAISRLDHPLLMLTKLRLPFFSIFPKSFAKPEVLNMRIRDMTDFWQSWERENPREDTMLKYHVSWVIAARPSDTLGDLPVINLNNLRIQRAFTNSDYIVFHILPRQN